MCVWWWGVVIINFIRFALIYHRYFRLRTRDWKQLMCTRVRSLKYLWIYQYLGLQVSGGMKISYS